MKIAIIGGGNGSFAAAGDLALAGHNVRLWRRNAEEIEAHRARGARISVVDHSGQREAVLECVTADVGAAVDDAELVLVPVPAYSHKEIARTLAPHLRDNQVVFLPPGTFGSFVFAQAARDAGNIANASFAETGTLPWLARKQDTDTVRISARAVRLPTGVFPSRNTLEAVDIISDAFPGVIEPCEDVLSAALMNAGPIIHPPLIMMNAGPIEHFERWDIHKEGTQPAIRRVTDKLDQERIAVREALGYGPPHFPLANQYKGQGEIGMYPHDAHERLTGSNDWREHLDLAKHRYMREDIQLGLSFLISAAALAEVPVPLARAFFAIGSTVAEETRDPVGRTLASLGLGELNRDELRALLTSGFRS